MGKWPRHSLWVILVLVLAGAVIGLVTGWFSVTPLKQEIRDTQLELLKDVVEDLEGGAQNPASSVK